MIYKILENNRLDRLRFFLLDYITKNIGQYPNAEPAEFIIANALKGLNVGKMNALSDVLYDNDGSLDGLSIKTLKKLTPIKKRTRFGKDNKIYFDKWWAPKNHYAIERRCQLINVTPYSNTPDECGRELISNFKAFERTSAKMLSSKFKASGKVESLVMMYGIQEYDTHWEYGFVLYVEPYKIHENITKWKFKPNGRELEGCDENGSVLYSWDSVSTRCLKKYEIPENYIHFTLRVDKLDANVTDDVIAKALEGQTSPVHTRLDIEN